jgi:lysophospholipase L1-like esterase
MSDRDNEGHNGWDLLEISGSVNSWLMTSTPEIILLLLGTNDIYENATGSTAAARLDALIAQIYGQLPDVSLIVASIPPLDSLKNEQVIAYNTLIPGVVANHAAASQRRIHFVDIFSVVSVADLVDGIHPGTAGYSKMAAAWFDKLIQVLAPPLPSP